MGKGTILGGGSGGQYSVEVELDTTRIQAEIARLSYRIAWYEALLETIEEGKRRSRYRILLTSLQKKKEYLENYTPSNPVISAWCADFSEDLSGTVGTIEVPGERGTVMIYPGGPSWYPAFDGILAPIPSVSPAAAFYNLAMKPGWQKWMPTYRFGTITAISGNNCSVSLENASNSETGLDINQTRNLSDVPISYMNCDGMAFKVDDEVLVEFQGQDWNSPMVIGFKHDPQQCCAIYDTYDNGLLQGSFRLFTYWAEPYINEKWIDEEGRLHIQQGNSAIDYELGGIGTYINIDKYPILRWSINPGEARDGGGFIILNVFFWFPGESVTRIYSWWIEDSYVRAVPDLGPFRYLFCESNPPGRIVEWIGPGLQEINLLELFGEDSGITIGLVSVLTYWNMESVIDFITLCPK